MHVDKLLIKILHLITQDGYICDTCKVDIMLKIINIITGEEPEEIKLYE